MKISLFISTLIFAGVASAHTFPDGESTTRDAYCYNLGQAVYMAASSRDIGQSPQQGYRFLLNHGYEKNKTFRAWAKRVVNEVYFDQAMQYPPSPLQDAVMQTCRDGSPNWHPVK